MTSTNPYELMSRIAEDEESNSSGNAGQSSGMVSGPPSSNIPITG